MNIGMTNPAFEPLKKSEFADFAYAFYLFTLHKAYGSLSGTEASDRLLKESVGLTSTGQDRLNICGACPPSCLNTLQNSNDLQKEILRRAMRLHFPDVSEGTLDGGLRSMSKAHFEHVGLVGRTRNFFRDCSPYQLISRFATFSMTENGGMIITFHLSERKQVWLSRLVRIALLSVVMSKGNLRASKLLFCLFSIAWTVQRVLRFIAKRWQSVTPIADEHEERSVHEDIAQAEMSQANSHGNVEGRVSDFFRQSVSFLAAFCISMNPNYES
mmetsp:Transcript_25643/g.39972  ORF Transcript_25643/g.39972 Transcript_25643/m.39972 type:complete len:271 (-) Transcript_25643:27-839(-)